MADLTEYFDEFAGNNADLIVIGCGKPDHIEEFRDVTGYPGKIYTDSSRESFKVLGLTSSVGGLLGMKTLSRGFSAIRQGIKPGSLQGNALQMGGAVVITTDSEIRYLYQSREAGDDPPVVELLDAVA